MKVLQEYNKLKQAEDMTLKNYLSSTNKRMLDEAFQKRQQEELQQRLEDLERLK